MTSPQLPSTAFKAEVASIRSQTSCLFVESETGEEIARTISLATDSILHTLLDKNLSNFGPDEIELIGQHSAIIAVGGSGRGGLAPYSDTDLLFLYRAPARDLFSELTSNVVRDCWDADIKLGHSLRTVEECLSLAKKEIEVATALVEARLLWGDEKLFDELTTKFQKQVTGYGKNYFIRTCIDSRNAERAELGMSPSQLEPNVKCSSGGLRDLHLIRWIAFAEYGTTNFKELQEQEAITEDDFQMLTAAHEFLLRIRINLHLKAQREQDVLTRDDQLRITKERKFTGEDGQRAVEKFMQGYFQQSTAVATFCKHFEAVHLPRTFSSKISRLFSSTFPNGHYRFANQEIDIPPHLREAFCGTLDQVLRVYRTAALHGVVPTASLTEEIKKRCQSFSREEISPENSLLFLDILRCSEGLGLVLRNMYDTGLLEIVIPDFTRTRCLLQFNQYHSYTVDEHTLLAVESAINFEKRDSPLGTTYRQLKHKKLLHLALLLHDLGKGFEEDHSDVGKRIADRIGVRLHLTEREQSVLTFLVHKHLMMSHLAFRRDLHDPGLLHQLTHDVGSAETLRMLYVLSAADLTAVGPGVFTNWKEELLTELFERSILILSGKQSLFDEEERIKQIKQHVVKTIVPLQSNQTDEYWEDWITQQLDAFAPHYLGNNSPQQIASDLQTIQQLTAGEVEVGCSYDPESAITEYTVIAHPDVSQGCFHRLTGLLTARRLEILTAEISTTLEGTIVDRFRVMDRDFSGDVPEFRQQEIIKGLKKSLTQPTKTALLFQKHMRFSDDQIVTVSNLPMRVVIDNDSSQFCTIVDIFAHDRRGLLFTVARALHKMNLSIILAKISTHVDQVVDVFYIKDSHGRKIVNAERLETIREELLCCIEEFESEGYLKFSP